MFTLAERLSYPDYLVMVQYSTFLNEVLHGFIKLNLKALLFLIVCILHLPRYLKIAVVKYVNS